MEGSTSDGPAMNTLIKTKELRASLPSVVEHVRRGARFTVVYRSRPAFRVIPLEATEAGSADLKSDPRYHAKPLGRSTDKRSAAEHDKDFSFTDCTSFVVRRELKPRKPLTTDRHFTQMGLSIRP